MYKITKKVDKAQARILTLVLIAVLFIGQALYDFIKKNRSRSSNRPRQTISKPKPQSPVSLNNHGLTKKRSDHSQRPAVSELAGLSALESEPSSIEKQILAIDQPSEDIRQHVNTTSSPAHSAAPDGDELRRAVIWSEILKRKF